jgi:hypothetical protein
MDDSEDVLNLINEILIAKFMTLTYSRSLGSGNGGFYFSMLGNKREILMTSISLDVQIHSYSSV